MNILINMIIISIIFDNLNGLPLTQVWIFYIKNSSENIQSFYICSECVNQPN